MVVARRMDVRPCFAQLPVISLSSSMLILSGSLFITQNMNLSLSEMGHCTWTGGWDICCWIGEEVGVGGLPEAVQ